MKELPTPLDNFYAKKRTRCFQSIRSFKYPYTHATWLAMPFYSRVVTKVTDVMQVIKLYEMSYVAIRTIDDIADEGEVKYGEKHLVDILDFLNSDRNAKNENELLLQYIFDTAGVLGRDVPTLRNSFINIFSCVAGDVRRRSALHAGVPMIRTNEEIERYVYQMEFEGIFQLVFELFNEKKQLHKEVWPLVKAGRWHFYLLRDVVEDIAEGLINIPKESLPDDIDGLVSLCKRLDSVKENSMRDRLRKIEILGDLYPEIRTWSQSQIDAGEKSLDMYRETSLDGASLRTRLWLRGSQRRTANFFRQARFSSI